jgi:DNA repair photolyase
MRGGKDYDSDWSTRMRGTGPYAWQIGRRFELAAKRLGFNRARTPLRTDLFVAADKPEKQLMLL